MILHVINLRWWNKTLSNTEILDTSRSTVFSKRNQVQYNSVFGFMSAIQMGVESTTQTVRQTRIQCQSDKGGQFMCDWTEPSIPCLDGVGSLYDGLSGGLNPSRPRMADMNKKNWIIPPLKKHKTDSFIFPRVQGQSHVGGSWCIFNMTKAHRIFIRILVSRKNLWIHFAFLLEKPVPLLILLIFLSHVRQKEVFGCWPLS